jgi:signal transduction histidine kinase
MFLKTFDASVFLLAIPVTISFVVGIILVYFNHQRSMMAQKKLKSHFFNQVENEKIKISRELHDSVSPFTLPLKEFIKNKGHFDEANNTIWLKEIEKFETYLSNINNNIYPVELLEGDLFEALEKLARRLSTQNTKIEIHTEVQGKVAKPNAIQALSLIHISEPTRQP